jgi:hypothetical protein
MNCYEWKLILSNYYVNPYFTYIKLFRIWNKLVGCQTGITCPRYVPTLETNCKQHKDISFSIMSIGSEQRRMLSCNEICSGSSQEIFWLATQKDGVPEIMQTVCRVDGCR